MTSAEHPRKATKTAAFLMRVSYGLVWLCGAVSVVLILTAFAITIYAVFMRYVMTKPLLWSDDITGWLLVALVMFGTAEAYRRGDHIAIDLLTGNRTGASKTIQRLCADLAVFVLAMVIFLSTWDAIAFARDFGAFTSGNIETEAWIPQLPMLAGTAMLGLVALTNIASAFLGRAE